MTHKDSKFRPEKKKEVTFTVTKRAAARQKRDRMELVDWLMRYKSKCEAAVHNTNKMCWRCMLRRRVFVFGFTVVLERFLGFRRGVCLGMLTARASNSSLEATRFIGSTMSYFSPG